MTRKLKIVLLTLGAFIVVGGLITFFYLRGLKNPSRNALEAVPSGAFCVISTTDARNTWEQLNQGNLVWAELLSTNWAAQTSSTASLVDSLLSANANMNELIEDNECFISLHCTGIDGFNYVFTLALPGTAYEDQAIEFVRQSATGYTVTESEMTNAKILTAKSGEKTFYCSVSQGVIQFSDNEELLKTGIEQLDKGKSLLEDVGFQAVRKTAGEKSVANVYVNYSRLLVLFKRVSDKSFHASLDALNSFAGWTEADLSLRPNAALMNGYTYASDSAAAYLNAFRGQQPQPLEADAVLPNGTVCYLDFSISNFETWLTNYDEYLALLGTANDRRDRLSQLKTNYGYDPNDHIGSWIGNEVVKAEVNISGEGIRSVAIISTVSTAKAREKLESLRPLRDTGSVQPGFDSSGVIVRSVPVPEMLSATFGPLFSEFRETYYAITSHYVIFAEDESTLKSFVTSAEYGRTLRKDRNYLDFASNMATSATVTLWASVPKMQSLIEERSEGGFRADVSHHADLLKKFDGIVLQYNIDDGNLHYTNAFLRHNPQDKQDKASLWETQLDTTFHSKPWLLTNHNTKGLDIFIQDDVNTIYLISSTGTIFWKREMNKPIISDIQQADALKNGKLQMVFNTEDSLYVVDRNGTPVAPFPIKIPGGATNGVRVFDYDNNREYRLLVASGFVLYNYNLKGKMVDGWKEPKLETKIVAPVQHTSVAGKDYIVFAGIEGDVGVVDRQGNLRFQLKEILGAPVTNFFLEQGKDLARTRIVNVDSLGNVYRLTFTDELERLHFADFGSAPFFEYRDLNGDGNFEYIFQSPDRLAVYNQDKLNSFSYGFESPCAGPLAIYRLGDNDLRIGVTCPGASEIHLINRGGADSEGFPLPGQTLFSIGKLNGENGYTVITGNGRYLSAYSIQ